MLRRPAHGRGPLCPHPPCAVNPHRRAHSSGPGPAVRDSPAGPRRLGLPWPAVSRRAAMQSPCLCRAHDAAFSARPRRSESHSTGQTARTRISALISRREAGSGGRVDRSHRASGGPGGKQPQPPLCSPPPQPAAAPPLGAGNVDRAQLTGRASRGTRSRPSTSSTPPPSAVSTARGAPAAAQCT